MTFNPATFNNTNISVITNINKIINTYILFSKVLETLFNNEEE